MRPVKLTTKVFGILECLISNLVSHQSCWHTFPHDHMAKIYIIIGWFTFLISPF
jgi:hypothetical protein